MERVEEHEGVEYVVRPVRSGDGPAYRCPGCDQEIPRVQPHVVVWPAQSWLGEPIEHRRHWHTPCWRSRAQRRRR